MSPMNNRLLRPTSNYDADALRYMNAVQVADGQALEPEVRTAIDAFVRGCKADGIWSAIKASCIMAGARTISGALVPLVGTAPTPYNFTASDYSRTTGIKGDGATTYLDTNRANDADGQNDNHNAVYVSSAATLDSGYIGVATPTGAPVFSGTHVFRTATNIFARSRSVNNTNHSTAVQTSTGLMAISRSEGSQYVFRAVGTNDSIVEPSVSPVSTNATVFARNRSSGVASLTDARLAFYSIGSAIPDLAALDARVTTLVTAIAAALS